MIIDDLCFKLHEELANGTIKKLVVDGGSEKVKESLVNVWNNSHEEKVAVVSVHLLINKNKSHLFLFILLIK